MVIITYMYASVHTNDVQTALLREAWGSLPNLLPLWPTSTLTGSSEALHRANPEDPTLSGQQVSPIFCSMPSYRVGRLSSFFPQKLYLGLGMVRYILLRKHLGTILSIFPIPDDTASTWNWPQRWHIWLPTIWQLRRPEKQVPFAPFVDWGLSLLPFPQTETGTLNRRNGSRHCNSEKTPPTRKEKNKETRPQQPVTEGSRTLKCRLDTVIPDPKCAS